MCFFVRVLDERREKWNAGQGVRFRGLECGVQCYNVTMFFWEVSWAGPEQSRNRGNVMSFTAMS
jgi:hypothetical protein